MQEQKHTQKSFTNTVTSTIKFKLNFAFFKEVSTKNLWNGKDVGVK